MQNIREHYTFLTTLIEEVPFGVISITQEGLVTLINKQALKFLGLESNAALYEDIPLPTFISNTRLKQRISASLEERSDFKLRTFHFKNRYLTISGRAMADGMIIDIIDVTKTVLLRDQATKNLVNTQETERRRLAKEIHDGIGPLLSTIRLQIDGISRRTDKEEIKDKLTEVNKHLSEVATEIRQISHALMPSSLMDFGLATVLENIVARLNDGDGPEVRLDINISDGELPKELELNIYRIIQELINNALKYAQCREIDIQLNRIDDQLNLTVYDDGVGISPDNHTPGNGLNNISTRVKSYRGYFEMDSTPGKGVNTLITIPLKKKKL